MIPSLILSMFFPYEVGDQILVQILSTDMSKKPSERVEKQFSKSGLYEAMDIGLIWLDKLNKK